MECVLDCGLVAPKEMRRDAGIVVVGSYFPRTLKQSARFISIAFNRHARCAEGDNRIVRINIHHYSRRRVVRGCVMNDLVFLEQIGDSAAVRLPRRPD